MKLAVISNPLDQHKADFFRLGMHMALTQEVMRDMNYQAHFNLLARAGHFIMIDNGAAEFGESVIFQDVIDASNSIDADEVALPDRLRDAKRTVELHIEHAYLVPEKNRMAVPQGSSVAEWIKCFEDLIDAIDFRTIGVPKLLDDYSAEGGRLAVLKYLERQGWHKGFHVHLLGCNKSPLKEIRDVVRKYPWVRSIDTAAPFGYAQSNQPVSYGKHLSYNWYKVTENSALASENILTLLDACRGL